MDVPECSTLKKTYDDCFNEWLKQKLPRLDFSSLSNCNEFFEVEPLYLKIQDASLRWLTIPFTWCYCQGLQNVRRNCDERENAKNKIEKAMIFEGDPYRHAIALFIVSLYRCKTFFWQGVNQFGIFSPRFRRGHLIVHFMGNLVRAVYPRCHMTKAILISFFRLMSNQKSKLLLTWAVIQPETRW